MKQTTATTKVTSKQAPQLKPDWLDVVLVFREALIMMLRGIDKILIVHGRIARPTPRMPKDRRRS